MKKILLFVITGLLVSFHLQAVSLESVYTLRPDDPEAFYFTPENYVITADGKTDVSDELQKAINQVKKEKNFGILFIPEGKYKISKTIYIPATIRLIGYGKKRPEFILAAQSPGYQEEVPNDKGKAKYMFWFTGSVVQPGRAVNDANAGTFYSAMSNINLRIEDGNPYAIALRTHYAQHSFVSHLAVYTGKGKAGLFDVGNELENVAFYGGDYGIYTTKASPGWQVMMVDAYFEGQRKAAVRCQESGLAMVNLQVKNVPTVFEIEPNYADRLFVENSRFENISGPVIIIANENNSNNQITFRNVICRNAPVLAGYRRSATQTKVGHSIYRIKNYAHGLQMDDMLARPEYRTLTDIEPMQKMPDVQARDIPALPDMKTWVNIRDLGAKGDGETDDTKVFQAAIDKYENIYVPQGWYRFTETLKMKPGTCLIGLHPFGTQFCLAESTPAFSGFGAPKALLESSEGGMNILNGIGINTGGYNYRAVGVKWMANAASYLNDVKFVGGHGGLAKPVPGKEIPEWRPSPQRISSPENPVAAQGMDLAWDNQHWSFWITRNGGGTFKDVWTASTYAASGLYVSDTHTPGRIYAMSLEHHVRNEARFKNVSNWKIYCFQLEEESREGTECQPVEMENCNDITFANLYMFRVIRINKPYPHSVRLWENCRNIEFLNLHNYSQIKYTTDNPVYDVTKNIEVRPWELQSLLVTGKETRKTPLTDAPGEVQELASGFEFAEGMAKDSKGNIYFSEQRFRRIYRWSVETNSLSMVADFPWEPLSLACDTEDNLLVIFRYKPQPGYFIDGKQESPVSYPDAYGTSFSGWGNSGFETRVYAVNPNRPEETIQALPKVPFGSVKKVHKALYPANRWRDFHDFNTVVTANPAMCFVAPDGKTIIPDHYDLARASSVLEAFPGKPFYASDEYDKRMVRMEVALDGSLSGMRYFVEWGEFGSAVDKEGNLYVADGDVHVFDKDGNRKGMIQIPERPTGVQFGGKDGNTLFITGRSKLFRIRIDASAKSETIHLIPKPAQMEIGDGFYLPATAEFIKYVRDEKIPTEGYRLTVNKNGVVMEASGETGFFYGKQTVDQLMTEKGLPYISIQDEPRFPYRGFMLDVSRHFYPKAFIFKLLDVISSYKLNTFHLHLTDGGGWRIQIDKYPELTKNAAFRDTENWNEWRKNGNRFVPEGTPGAYGGYYTKDDIREIVAYAASKHITVIPEIEMPGHSSEVFVAYPDLCCSGEDYHGEDFCIGNEDSFTFIENVLTEIIDLFPSKYIHVGGDEASKRHWRACPKCRERMKAENFTHIDELQSYMIKRMDKFLNAKGRKLIGWDEIMEGGLASNAAVMSWQSEAGGIKAARMGHDVVMSPTSYLYLDYYQADPPTQPFAIGGYIPVKRVYGFNPVQSDSLNPVEKKHILGLQANLWTEFIPDESHVEYMAFPRLLAVAEAGWTPQEKRDWQDFKIRMNKHIPLLLQKNVNAFQLSDEIETTMTVDTIRKEIKVILDAEKYPADIRYTTDGSTPTLSSRQYNSPIVVKDSARIVAAIFRDGVLQGAPAEKKVDYHRGINKPIHYNNRLSSKYMAGGMNALLDGFRGGLTYLDGLWQGYTNDLDCVIDMEEITDIHQVSARFMQIIFPQVFQPGQVEMLTSEDGVNFTSRGVVPTHIPNDDKNLSFQEYTFSGKWKTRYIRLIAKEVNKGSFIFTDEIVVW